MLISKKQIFWASRGFAAGLIGLLALELGFALDPPDQPRPMISDQAVNQQNADPPQSAIAIWRAEILARPLFDPSRRPPAAAPPARAVPMDVPRLSGIMITPTEKIAVLSPAMGGPIIVAKDSRFGPFTVLSITADAVTVKGPNGIITLRSDFSYQGPSAKSTPENIILSGGIDLKLIQIPLPSTTTWLGPPSAN